LAIELDRVLDVGGFNLSRATELDPKFLETEYPFEWAGAYLLPSGTHELVIGHDDEDHDTQGTITATAITSTTIIITAIRTNWMWSSCQCRPSTNPFSRTRVKSRGDFLRLGNALKGGDTFNQARRSSACCSPRGPAAFCCQSTSLVTI